MPRASASCKAERLKEWLEDLCFHLGVSVGSKKGLTNPHLFGGGGCFQLYFKLLLPEATCFLGATSFIFTSCGGRGCCYYPPLTVGETEDPTAAPELECDQPR